MDAGIDRQRNLPYENETPELLSSDGIPAHTDETGSDTKPHLPDTTLDAYVGHNTRTLSQGTLPELPAISARSQMKRQQRHSKRLSLNFPILIPTKSVTGGASPEYSASPTTASSRHSDFPMIFGTQTLSSSASSTFPTPLTPPSESSEDNLPLHQSTSAHATQPRKHMRSHTLAHAVQTPTSTPDFLTLLAGQERKVLELKEELQRAEIDLQDLKKQWAAHEATRKKGELKHGVVKMSSMAGSPVSPGYGRNHARDYGVTRTSRQGHTRSATAVIPAGTGADLNTIGANGDLSVTEREKRRTLIQERLTRRATIEHVTSPQGPRRTGQRMFSGSRHTRALSLLTTNDITGGADKTAISALSNTSAPSTTSPVSSSREDDEISHDVHLFMPALIRSNSGLARELDFRKTYKDLASAASRRSLPPGADVLMKQGRLVVDGVRDGLWNFFEDIRQATVGEEAAREVESERYESSKGRRKSMQKRDGDPNADSKESEPSFWSEFGIATPKADKVKAVAVSSSKIRNKPMIFTKKNITSSLSESDPDTSTRDRSSVLHERTEGPVSQKMGLSNSSPDLEHVQFQNSRKQKKEHEHHESKGSTDSRDSRDSHNPPSLLSDTLTEEHEGEDESWEWGEIDSPRSVRKVGFAVSNNSKAASGNKTASDIGRREDKEVLWHELTR